MKKVFFSVLFITFSSALFAQKDTTVQSISDSIFEKVDVEASFPGGAPISQATCRIPNKPMIAMRY